MSKSRKHRNAIQQEARRIADEMPPAPPAPGKTPSKTKPAAKPAAKKPARKPAARKKKAAK